MGRFSGIVDTGTAAEMRLDRYAADRLGLLSRSQIKNRSTEVKLNGKTVKLSKQVRSGDSLELVWLDSVPQTLEPENIPLDILYEDSRVIVVNKAAGMVVHPGAGNHGGTLANALLYRRLRKNLLCGETPGRDGQALRTGIVHRLDKDTSGVIIAAWDDSALAFLAAQFKAGKTKKRYAALVTGTPENAEGIITGFVIRDRADRKKFTVTDVPGKGKAARTRYRVIRSWGAYSLLLLRPKTGRTHQLRVHLKSIGHPVAGDPIYGYKEKPSVLVHKGLMLHAYSLEITLPGPLPGALRREGAPLPDERPALFKAPLPLSFRENIAALKRRFP
ncbi:MAG: RluA family pseudouridine synthase [Treponema sp.]|jgi:23S rRNA pseudouridine1911/1915/1917 synthase|nr:RluA family pseudouridine synthase [Treponema sp.]